MTQLTFNETTWEFRTHYGETTSVHIFKNGDRLENWNIRLEPTKEDNCKIAQLLWEHSILAGTPFVVVIYDNIFRLEDTVKIISFIENN